MYSDIEKAKGLLREWESGTPLEIECSVAGSDKLVVRGCAIHSLTDDALDLEWSLSMTETVGFILSSGKVQIALTGTALSTFGDGRRTGVQIELKGQVSGTVRIAPAIPL